MRIVSILSTDAFDVRLGGNETSKEGHLEMKVRGQWVAVNAEYWTASATSVVCRQLGLHGANLSYAPHATDTAKNPFFNLVGCHGDEAALTDCTNNGLAVMAFQSYYDLYVSCQIGKTSTRWSHCR